MELSEKINAVYQTSKSYPETAKALITLGIKTYTVDVASSTILYRLNEGEQVLHFGTGSVRKVNEVFSREDTIQAVKDTQKGRLTYPEFMDAIAKSGVRFYEATLEGKHKRVTYIGSNGLYEETIPFE